MHTEILTTPDATSTGHWTSVGPACCSWTQLTAPGTCHLLLLWPGAPCHQMSAWLTSLRSLLLNYLNYLNFLLQATQKNPTQPLTLADPLATIIFHSFTLLYFSSLLFYCLTLNHMSLLCISLFFCPHPPLPTWTHKNVKSYEVRDSCFLFIIYSSN